MYIFLSVLSGFLCTLVFPKHDFPWVAWVALVPFFIALLRCRKWWQAFISGQLFSFVFFGSILFWINIIKAWVGESVAVSAWFLLVLFQSLFIVIFSLVFYFLFKYIKNNYQATLSEVLLVLLAPAAWIVCEWLRSSGPLALSAGILGYSQYTILPVVQISSLFGVYGISFILVMINFCLARFAEQFLYEKNVSNKSLLTIFSITALTLCIFLLYGYIHLHTQINTFKTDKKITLAVFQPNNSLESKLNPKNHEIIKNHYIQETVKFLKTYNTDLFIWPETIVPRLLLRDRFFIFKITHHIKKPVLFGTPTIYKQQFFNSMVLLDTSGKNIAQYDKKHLVPFGEYLPLRKIVYPFLKQTDFFNTEYTHGEKMQSFITPWGKFACGICFESIIPHLLRKQVSQGAEILITITNDGWFKNSAGLEMHMSLAVLRAVENRKYLIQAANTGISFIADPQGRVIRKAAVEKQAWLNDTVYLNNLKTFYTLFGDLLVYAAMCYLLFLLFGSITYYKKLVTEKKTTRLRKEII